MKECKLGFGVLDVFVGCERFDSARSAPVNQSLSLPAGVQMRSCDHSRIGGGDCSTLVQHGDLIVLDAHWTASHSLDLETKTPN